MDGMIMVTLINSVVVFLMIRRPPKSTRTDTLSLHDALPIWRRGPMPFHAPGSLKFETRERRLVVASAVVERQPLTGGRVVSATRRGTWALRKTEGTIGQDRKSTRLNSSH